jgi:glycosyltransferase involved in cell wall biosynthesis
MLTYNRFEFFKESFQCFLNQTHQNKELIIVDNGNDEYFDLVESVVSDHKDCVKHIHINNKTIGMYRYEGLQHAKGDYICTWDDDDIHGNDRITYELSIINNHNVDCVLLMDFIEMKTQHGITSAIEARMTMGLDGTIMFRNPRGGICYANINRGEDTRFMADLCNKLGYKTLVVKNDPSLYTYRFHGGNITVTNHEKSLVSCICLTHNRLELFKESFNCFLKQTYNNKELIIVNNGTDEYFQQIEEVIKDYKSIVTHTHTEKATTGEYRNIGMELCNGDYICTWDDDDLLSPNKIMYQMKFVNEENADIVMLTDYILMDMRDGVSSIMRNEGGHDPSILFKNTHGNVKYDSVMVNEDTQYVEKLMRKTRYRLMTVRNNPEMYIYRMHGENLTSK